MLQSLVLAQSEESRHQRVPLFSTFALRDVVHDAVLVGPDVARLTTVEKTHTGQKAFEAVGASELVQDRRATNVVERTDTIDRRDDGVGIRVRDALKACPTASVPALGCKAK